MKSKVEFWKRLDGIIVAQKKDKFFTIPTGYGFGETRESRETIAENFDKSPMLDDSVENFVGAELIDTVEVEDIEVRFTHKIEGDMTY